MKVQIRKISLPWLFIVFPIIPFILGIILIPLQWRVTLLFIGLALLFGIPVIIWRKFIFGKISLDEKGVSEIYKNKIISQINWEEMKKVLVQRISISFHKSSDKNNMWLMKNYIAFRLIENYKERLELENICQIINENKHKIPCSIEMIKPNPKIVDLLK